jgi:hypothetical protein
MNGLGIGLKCFVMYVLLMELLPGKAALATSVAFFFDGLIFIWASLILMYIAKNTTIFFYISFFISVTSLIGFNLINLSESIKWQLVKG